VAIRVSCHGITWGRDGLDRAIEDLRTLGFHGFEAFAFVADDYGFGRLAEFQALLARNALQLVALYGAETCTTRLFTTRSWRITSASLVFSRRTAQIAWCSVRDADLKVARAEMICSIR